MKLDELIQRHNQALNRKVEENAYLKQHLIARLHERNQARLPSLLSPFLRSILTYSFLLVLFTVLNFMLIHRLVQPDLPPRPTPQIQQMDLLVNAFSPTYPGSISHAYAEVMQ